MSWTFQLAPGLIVGARAMSGIPELGVKPWAMTWIRWQGRVIWMWDEPAGSA